MDGRKVIAVIVLLLVATSGFSQDWHGRPSALRWVALGCGAVAGIAAAMTVDIAVDLDRNEYTDGQLLLIRLPSKALAIGSSALSTWWFFRTAGERGIAESLLLGALQSAASAFASALVSYSWGCAAASIVWKGDTEDGWFEGSGGGEYRWATFRPTSPPKSAHSSSSRRRATPHRCPMR